MKNNLEIYYDKRADWDPDYFDWKISRYRANQAILRSFDWIDWKEKRVLDIGCGQGFYAIPIARRCRQIVGFDLSAANVEIAARHAARYGLSNVQFCQADLFDFAPEGLFDVAYAVTVLMHITDVPGALAKIATFLNPGGLLLISDLNRSFHTRLLPMRQKSSIYYRTFSFKELRENLSYAGFRVVRESGRLYSVGGLRKPDWVIMGWMEEYARFWPVKYLGEHIVLLAQKQALEA